MKYKCGNCGRILKIKRKIEHIFKDEWFVACPFCPPCNNRAVRVSDVKYER